jgi:hypothetical protein
MVENEILGELWKIKDEIASENNFDIDAIAAKLREKERNEKQKVINLSRSKKAA